VELDYLSQHEEDLRGEEADSLELPIGRLVTDKEFLFIEQELKTLNAGENGFFPLPLCHLVHFNALPCDIYQENCHEPGLMGRFSLAWPRGEVLSQTDVTRLDQPEKALGYVPAAEVDQVLQTFLHFLERDLFLSHMTGLDQIKLLTALIVLWMNHFFLHTPGRNSEQYHQGVKLMEKLCGLIEPMPNPYAVLLPLRHPESGIDAHSLNVCLISLAFIHFLGFSAPMALRFGLGALLHDIGMVPFARQIVSKEGCLSPEDMAEIKAHPHRGNNVLREVADIPPEVLLMVSQHHENLDGSGYPVGLEDGQIHPWARILRVIDSYESITAPRPWRAPFPPDRALVIVKTAWKAKPDYDPHFLQFFILFLEEIQARTLDKPAPGPNA
jgi:HD-GYP domain-containing protein (c-di-GMP phosphodiesterase class II)